ncbi:Uncharacterized conserved protein, DUF497 family [Methylomagnum ishizawai]|uniref:Uncharacterized conserved protein, DUF497 family n=1 Tax=Methylomagnum ishizawai TaxID=1760988 RepID=A0A1Y6D3E0_9GAMM|nr:BrnT family toxin [Methylomagnum ishizawai]SMF94914.1 Uncharacterized conserved protein, DUF497 family [Methylomagnum ishizawai]
MIYDFEWDPHKADINYRKHGISFERASEVFRDPLALTVYDVAHSDYEERWNTLGLDQSLTLLVVAHTYQVTGPSNAIVRIISARLASKREQQNYSEEPNIMGVAMNQDNILDQNDDLPAEIDFSKGTRGKFYHPDLKFNIPIYLDEEVQRYLAAIASRKGISISDVANDLLKKDIAMIEAMR